jgi:hypothetical protein
VLFDAMLEHRKLSFLRKLRFVTRLRLASVANATELNSGFAAIS